jgi:type IV secretory pathway VirB3-like protein
MINDGDNAVLQIEFSIDARDLFRASIDMAKLRLLLGLGISLALITGLFIFFVIIDEKLILLQTSPLFIGIPLLAVGGRILRMHAVCRKYVSGLSSLQRRMRYTFHYGADSYEVASGESSSRISWNDVLKAVEKRKYFLIYFNKFEMQLIPKTAIQGTVQAALLRQLLLAKLGSRAKLAG